MKERHKIICAAYLFLIKNKKILLLRRFNTGYEDGNYSVPAGHVDKGESVATCLIREAKEEIGIEVKKRDINLVHVMHRNSTDDNDERLDFFFACNGWSGDVANIEPEKCDELKWFALNALPPNVIPYIKQAIESTQKKITYSELYW